MGMLEIAKFITESGAKYKLTRISKGSSRTSEPRYPAKLYRHDGDKWQHQDTWPSIHDPGSNSAFRDYKSDDELVREAKEERIPFYNDGEVETVTRTGSFR